MVQGPPRGQQMRRGIILAAALGGACSSDTLSQVHSKIQLCADDADTACVPPLDMGAFRVPDAPAGHLWAKDLGEGFLEIQKVEVLSGPLAPGALPDRIAATLQGEIGLAVTPALGVNTGRIAVISN